jgi:DNA-binding winged helix-turn-helix (wHTH) protein|tara:strand:- start:172 stop:369 length:198 start_codon:yes stop_codon:yes gene_type:complete
MNVINYLKEKAKSYVHQGNVCEIAEIIEGYNSELIRENKMLRSKISRIRKALGDELNKSDNPTSK